MKTFILLFIFFCNSFSQEKTNYGVGFDYNPIGSELQMYRNYNNDYNTSVLIKGLGDFSTYFIFSLSERVSGLLNFSSFKKRRRK